MSDVGTLELAVWLCVVGGCDLVRAARDVTPALRRAAIVGAGSALFAAAALADADLGLGDGLVLWLGWVASFSAWVLGSAAALVHRSVAARAVAFTGLFGGIAFGLLSGGRMSVTDRLPGVLGSFETGSVVLLTGVLLAQLATGNIVVRLLLDAVGVPASDNEKKLKGGRMLGPMERVFLVGLGVAGSVTAAAVVVGAKGLLRFPELQWGVRHGPSDITEYFLIGSFASWLLALGGVALVALG